MCDSIKYLHSLCIERKWKRCYPSLIHSLSGIILVCVYESTRWCRIFLSFILTSQERHIESLHVCVCRALRKCLKPNVYTFQFWKGNSWEKADWNGNNKSEHVEMHVGWFLCAIVVGLNTKKYDKNACFPLVCRTLDVGMNEWARTDRASASCKLF